MEDLNKQQLILLVLLVSFVTSIATGIITVSLLQEAPVEVTQSINRVVERTIERAVTEGGNTTIKEITTVVKEEDLILESIDKNIKSIVRLKTLGADGSEITSALGLVVSADGIIVIDERSFGGGNYSALFYDGAVYNIAKSFRDPNAGLVFLKAGKAVSDSYKFYPVVLGNPANIKLGQTLIAVSGRERNTVSVGRTSDIDRTSTGEIRRIITDIRFVRNTPGSPILNLNGEVLGFEAPVSEGIQTLSYYPINIVQNSLKTALIELAK